MTQDGLKSTKTLLDCNMNNFIKLNFNELFDFRNIATLNKEHEKPPYDLTMLIIPGASRDASKVSLLCFGNDVSCVTFSVA